MAGVYVIEGIFNKDPGYVKQDFSLFELFDSGNDFVVRGVKFLQKGSDEWSEELRRLEALFRRMDLPLEDITRIIASCCNRDFLAIETGFKGMRYLAEEEGGGNPFPVLVADSVLDKVCGIEWDRKRILVLPHYREHMQPEHRYFHHENEAGWGRRRFCYDGGLRESLQSFQEQGFVFHKGIWAGNLGMRKPVINPSEVSLDEIFAVQS